MKLPQPLVGLLSALAVAAILLGPTHGEERIWTDRTGKHTIEAEFVRFNDGQVTLRKSDGKLTTLPFEKLSQEDQALIREQESTTARSPLEDRKAVRSSAKKFFEALRKGSRKSLRATLTGDAKRQSDDEDSAISKLPTPDRGAAIRVGHIDLEGDAATAEVRVRVKATYQQTTLHLRRESEQWLVHAISATGPNGGLVTFDFEETGDATAGRPTDSDDRRFEVPDGSPKELLAFIKKLKEAPLPTDMDRAGMPQYQKRMAMALLEAIEKIFAGEPSKSQMETAANQGLDALRFLTATGASGISERLADFLQKMEQLDLANLAAKTKTLVLLNRLMHFEQGSLTEARALFTKIERHLRAVDLGVDESSLAKFTGRAAERLGPEVAGEIYETLGQLLANSDDRSVGHAGTTMLGVARRFQLVGKPMPIEGFTLDGNPFDWSEFEGKVVLVDFWATWCGPCMQEMPNILKNYDAYHDRGFDVVAISVDKQIKALEAYVEQEQPPWTVLADYHKKVDSEHRMSTYYGISGIPTTILIGPDGNVISLNCRGPRLGTELKRLLDRSNDLANPRNSRPRS